MSASIAPGAAVSGEPAAAHGEPGSSDEPGATAAPHQSTAATGCGTDPDAENSAQPAASITFDLSPAQTTRVRAAKVDAIAAEVPQAIRDRGTLVVTGASGTAPPLRFYATDDKTVVGSEIDFASLIADILGLKLDAQVADWTQNFVRVDSGEANVFISNVTVTDAFQRYDPETAELKRIWTSREYRRQGLGRFVLEQLEAEIARRGYRRIYLTTGPRQPEAVALYLAAGYAALYDPDLPAEEIGPHPFEKHVPATHPVAERVGARA